MNLKSTFLYLFICLSTTFSATAQDHPFGDYTFSDEKIEIPAAFQDKNEIILLLNRKVEIQTDDAGVYQYYLHHQKILVNSDDAIEKNNKIYIGLGQGEELVINTNRVILPDGTTRLLNEEDIHEETDPETGRKYKYYAVQGLEIGAIIEKLYISKETPYFKGLNYRFQLSAPIVSANFQLIYPKHLIFKYKSYNGLEEATLRDSLYEDKDVLEVSAKNLRAANYEEIMANPVVHIQSFRYKLYENLITKQKNFYNYNAFAEGFSQNMSSELKKKDKKSIKKFIKNLELTDNEIQNVLNIENLIKSNIAYNANYTENESISDLIKAKQGNLIYVIKLYKAIFNESKIKAEFVLTTNRYKKYFDLDFETSNNLDEVLIYLPNIEQYLDPTDMISRSPLFDYNLGNHYGLHIKEKMFGGSIMYVAKTKFIELPGMSVTTDSMKIAVNFQDDIENPLVKSKIMFGGYSGGTLQAYKDLIPPSNYQEFLTDISKNYAADVEMESIEAENDGMENFGKGNFTLKVKFYAGDLLEQAGDKYLFKLGQLIGKQTEIYQTEERMFPVELNYGHYYYRTLDITLPDGYKISNPEVLNMNYVTLLEGKEEAIFKCSYSQEGNKLSVSNIEYYDALNYPVEAFEDYQAVINAAADFNKIVLVLEAK